jgi:4'-phosphopantetheinyl transferase
MALIIYTKDIGDYARLGVWKADEPTDELFRMARLTDSEKLHFATIKLEKRKREWLTTRILLRILANGKDLSFLPSGKPLLSHGQHISISHSGALAGVVVSSKPVGLDIQGIDEKLLRIEKKFVNAPEQSYLPNNSYRVEYLTVIWSAKEAVFKYFGELVDFADHIQIAPFIPSQTEIKAKYDGHYGHHTFTLLNMMVAGQHILMTMAEDDAVL